MGPVSYSILGYATEVTNPRTTPNKKAGADHSPTSKNAAADKQPF